MAKWSPNRDDADMSGEYQLSDLAELRRAVYALLGSLFLYPGEEEIEGVVAASAGLRRQADLAEAFSFFPRLRLVLELAEGAGDEARRRLEEEYLDLFAFSASQPPCPPFESAYVDGKPLGRGLVAVEVQRAYAASGVTLASPGELPDHVALELAFLSLLCAEEGQAWREAQVDQAASCLHREKAFHDQHLQRWFPTFARRVSLVAAPASLYRHLAEAARAFVVHDRDLIQALAEARSLYEAGNLAPRGRA